MTRYTKLAVGLQFLQVNLQGEDGREERVREEIENRGSGGEWGRRGVLMMNNVPTGMKSIV